MRFKKLRVFIAIALVAFLLVYGIITVSGSLSSQDDGSSNGLKLLAPVIYSEKTTPTKISSSEVPTVVVTPTQVTASPSSPTNVVTHTRVRTRAS